MAGKWQQDCTKREDFQISSQSKIAIILQIDQGIQEFSFPFQLLIEMSFKTWQCRNTYTSPTDQRRVKRTQSGVNGLTLPPLPLSIFHFASSREIRSPSLCFSAHSPPFTHSLVHLSLRAPLNSPPQLTSAAQPSPEPLPRNQARDQRSAATTCPKFHYLTSRSFSSNNEARLMTLSVFPNISQRNENAREIGRAFKLERHSKTSSWALSANFIRKKRLWNEHKKTKNMAGRKIKGGHRTRYWYSWCKTFGGGEGRSREERWTDSLHSEWSLVGQMNWEST